MGRNEKLASPKNGMPDALVFGKGNTHRGRLDRLQGKELTMFRLTTTIGAMVFFGSSWASGEIIPRFTHSAADYVLMPLLGYLILIVAAHCAARLLPDPDKF